ncbi:11599_t:CDS:2, partial [Ambispora leptoticha]
RGIAKKLEIEFVKAVIGFNFQFRRCVSIFEGIVVTKENEEIVLEAWRAHSEVVAAQGAARRRKRAEKIEERTEWRE